MTQQHLDKLWSIQAELENINTVISSTQSINHLIDLGGTLSAWMAYTGEQMSVAKRTWRRETAQAYDNHVFSRLAQGMEIQATLANKYAASKAGGYEADYEFVERINRSCVHILDFIRTAISALKEENKAYLQNNNTL